MTKINQKETIFVCFQADKNFTKQLAVSIMSLVDNYVDNRRLTILVISNDIGEGDKRKISKACERKAKVEILWKRPIENNLANTKIGRHWSMAALYKLQLPLLLGPNIDKVVYLDSDIVVLGNIAELWDVDIAGKPLAACGEKGLNSGIMLVNIKAWRERNIGQKCIEFMEKYPSEKEYSDQDALNQVLRGEWERLPWKWNKSPRGYTPATRIVHFLTKKKPWTIRGIFVPCRKIWYDYLNLTPYAGWKLSSREILCQLGVLIKNFFRYRFNIKEKL